MDIFLSIYRAFVLAFLLCSFLSSERFPDSIPWPRRNNHTIWILRPHLVQASRSFRRPMYPTHLPIHISILLSLPFLQALPTYPHSHTLLVQLPQPLAPPSFQRNLTHNRTTTDTRTKRPTPATAKPTTSRKSSRSPPRRALWGRPWTLEF